MSLLTHRRKTQGRVDAGTEARPEHPRQTRGFPSWCNRYDDEDWTRLAHIIIQGAATVLTRGETHRKAVRLLRRKYPQYRVMALDERPVIRIRVARCIRWGRI